MRYLSICSGIEAATQAWHPLGWQPVAFAEVEPFPSAVLAHHYPSTPNLGDLTQFRQWPADLLTQADLLVGGTPCQAFSVAGLRQSLNDERGNLTLTLVHLYDHLTTLRHAAGRPAPLLVWENVPGVLNTRDNAFGCFLGALAGEDGPLRPPGGRWKDAGHVRGPSRTIAWRCLDAQYFGLAQRRERVFLVAGPPGFRAEQVLFEFHGLRRNTPPRREAGEGPAGTLSARTQGGGGLGTDFELGGGIIAYGGNNTSSSIPVTPALTANRGTHNPGDFEAGTLLVQETAHTLRAEGFDASEDGTGRGTPIVPIAFSLRGREGGAMPEPEPDNLAVQRAASGGSSRSYVAIAEPVYAIQERAVCENPDAGPDGVGVRGDNCAYTLEARPVPQAIAFSARARGDDGRGYNRPPQVFGEVCGALDTMKPHQVALSSSPSPHFSESPSRYAVRRLTPTECERLQGFPDDYTAIPWRGKPASQCPDGPRYKALGNSMAVPVMHWIGQRLGASSGTFGY